MYVFRRKNRRDRRSGRLQATRLGLVPLHADMDDEEVEFCRLFCRLDNAKSPLEKVARLRLEELECQKAALRTQQLMDEYLQTPKGQLEVDALVHKTRQAREKERRSGMDAAALARAERERVSRAEQTQSRREEIRKKAEERVLRMLKESEEIQRLSKDEIAAKVSETGEEAVAQFVESSEEKFLDETETEALQNRAKVRAVFDTFNSNHSDAISHLEMRNLLNALAVPVSDEALEKLVKEIDSDQSGDIDFEEFYQWFRRNAEEHKKGNAFTVLGMHSSNFLSRLAQKTMNVQAQREIVAHAKSCAQVKTRKLFRRHRKPKFVDEETQVAFATAEELKRYQLMRRNARPDEDDNFALVREVVTDEKFQAARLVFNIYLYNLHEEPSSIISLEDVPTHISVSDPTRKRRREMEDSQNVQGVYPTGGRRAQSVQFGFQTLTNPIEVGRSAMHPQNPREALRTLHELVHSASVGCKENVFVIPNESQRARVVFTWNKTVVDRVIVVGEFTGWHGFTLKKMGVSVFLPPGQFLYYFVVDSKRCVDETKPVVHLQNVQSAGKEEYNVVTVLPPFSSRNCAHTSLLAARNIAEGSLSPDAGVSQVFSLENSAVTSVCYERHKRGEIGKLHYADVGLLDDGAMAISPWLKQMEKMESFASLEVDLSANEIGDVGIAFLSQALSCSLRVSSLNLSKNFAGLLGCERLSEKLRENGYLTALDLSFNPLGDDGVEALSEKLLSGAKSLKLLKLSHCGFGDLGADSLAKGLRTNASLVNLQIAENRISRVGAGHLASALKINGKLEILNLAQNQCLGPLGALAICESLSNGIKRPLKFLDLSYTQMCANGRRDGVHAVVRMLEKHRGLEVLKVRGNQLGEYGVIQLARALQQNITLLELDLQHNQLNDHWVRTTPEAGKETDTYLEFPPVTELLRRNRELRKVENVKEFTDADTLRRRKARQQRMREEIVLNKTTEKSEENTALNELFSAPLPSSQGGATNLVPREVQNTQRDSIGDPGTQREPWEEEYLAKQQLKLLKKEAKQRAREAALRRIVNAGILSNEEEEQTSVEEETLDLASVNPSEISSMNSHASFVETRSSFRPDQQEGEMESSAAANEGEANPRPAPSNAVSQPEIRSKSTEEPREQEEPHAVVPARREGAWTLNGRWRSTAKAKLKGETRENRHKRRAEKVRTQQEEEFIEARVAELRQERAQQFEKDARWRQIVHAVEAALRNLSTSSSADLRAQVYCVFDLFGPTVQREVFDDLLATMGILLSKRESQGLFERLLNSGDTSQTVSFDAFFNWYVDPLATERARRTWSVFKRTSTGVRDLLGVATVQAQRLLVSLEEKTVIDDAREAFRTQVESPPYACPFCHRSFALEKSYQKHMAAAEAEKELYSSCAESGPIHGQHVRREALYRARKVLKQRALREAGITPEWPQLWCLAPDLPYGTSVNVYSEADLKSMPISNVREGEVTVVLSVKDHWARVAVGSDFEGWLRFHDGEKRVLLPLTPLDAVAPKRYRTYLPLLKMFTSTKTKHPDATDIFRVDPTVVRFDRPMAFNVNPALPDSVQLKVRSSPTQDALVLGTLTKETGVLAVGRNRLWLHVYYMQGGAFCPSDEALREDMEMKLLRQKTTHPKARKMTAQAAEKALTIRTGWVLTSFGGRRLVEKVRTKKLREFAEEVEQSPFEIPPDLRPRVPKTVEEMRAERLAKLQASKDAFKEAFEKEDMEKCARKKDRVKMMIKPRLKKLKQVWKRR